MTEDKATYQVMSDERLAALERILAEGVPINNLSTRELSAEVRRLRQRERELCVLMGWMRGYITWDAASKALNVPGDMLAFRQSGRLQSMVDAAIDQGKRIIEETKKAASWGD